MQRPEVAQQHGVGLLGQDLAGFDQLLRRLTDDYFIDFLKAFGKERGEYVAGYAVAYITANAEMKVTLALSTNDQGKAWLNGKPVFRFADTRTLEKDTDRADVTLVKGQNVLVLKVINEVNNWQACARFLSNGAPATGLTVSVAPAGK